MFQISEEFEYKIEKQQEFIGNRGSKFTIYPVNPNTLFSLNFMTKLVQYLNSNPGSNVVLTYKGFSLRMIKTAFKTIKIQISGGNNTLKHIFSPQQFLLSKIIAMFYGYNTDLVTKSFLEISNDKNISRAVHDFTSEKDLLLLQELLKKHDSLEPEGYERLVDAEVENSKNKNPKI